MNEEKIDTESVNRIVTPPVNMNYDELKKIRREKIDLCIAKLNGEIDEVEKGNQEFLLWTLKKILLNIKMIDSKLLRKFLDKMDNIEKETLIVEMNILEATERLIKDIKDVELVVEQINIGLSNEKNKEIIESKNLPYSNKLLMIPTPKNCEPSLPEWICNILIKNYLLATLATTTYDAEYFKFIYNNLNSMYKLDNILKGEEKETIDKLLNNDPSVDKNKLSWLYEECFVLAWIIGLCEFPQQESENNTKILDDLLFIKSDEINKRNLPSKLFDLLYDKETKRFNYDKLKSKKLSEILEKADLIKRYLWALEELRINKQDNKSGINEKVVFYQLEAFRKILHWDLTNPGKYMHDKIKIKMEDERKNNMIKIETLNLLNKNDVNFKDLLSICIGKAYLYQRRFIDYIGKYNHWDVDLLKGILHLDDKKYNIECIGTTSKNDNYWYSSEIEKVIPDEYVDLMIKTRVNLEKLQMPKYLTDTKIALNENINGFNLSMIYIAFAPINVAYFCGSGDTSIHMFVKDLPENIFSKLKSTELFSLITDITSTFDVNHKLMIKALLTEMEYSFVEENNKLIANFSNNSKIEIEFDGNNFVGLRGSL